MNFSKEQIYSIVLLCFIVFAMPLQAENKPVKNSIKTNTASSSTKLDLNNLSTYIYNDGRSDNDLFGNASLTFPRGSNKQLMFASGFFWGGKINDSVHVTGATYTSGLQPGRIISPGKAEDTILADRIYRVRPEYKEADLSIEAGEEGKTESEVRSQYEKDWMEWPASQGAPYVDVDGDGKYDPSKDIPGIKDAVQTIWYVANDLNPFRTQALYGSYPMGIELQTTIWAYDKDWILNNTYFKKFKLINKSSNTFKDMYFGLWADPDLGDATDDFAACDTLLSLGYVYNATNPDAVYGNKPPAVGFSVLQGPLVEGSSSDSAIFNGRRIHRMKNLPMTSFSYFIGGDPNYNGPVLNNYQRGSLYCYNLLQGKLGPTGEYYPVPSASGGGVTKFPLSGDPVSGTGYLDGKLFPKGDRRIGVSSGPFNMAPGDTQEVAISEIAAQSASNLMSVNLLKFFSAEVKKKYENFFPFTEIPAPPAPKITGTYTKNSITINIPEDAQIENFEKDGFKFQGYNLYQLPSGVQDKKKGVYLGTFDKIDGITSIVGRGVDTLSGDPVDLVQQKGTDSGILREFTLSRDSLGHAPFLIGKKYYFGISAYTYRSDTADKFTNTEGKLGIAEVTFQDSLQGLKFQDSLSIKKISGLSEGTVTPIVIDASRLTGHEYEVGFNMVSGYAVMYLKDLTLNKLVTENQSALYGNAFSPVYDGIYIKLNNVQPGMKDWQIPQGTLKWSWSGASIGLEGFHGAIGYGGTWLGTSVSSDKLHNVLVKFAATDTTGSILSPSDPNVSYAYRYLRGSSQEPMKPEFAQYIINKGSGYAYQDFVKNFPFAAYDMESTPPRRLAVGYLENNSSGGLVNGRYWPPRAGQDNVVAAGPREWFFIFDVSYSETADAALQGNPLSGTFPVFWMGTPTRAGSFSFSSEDQFLIQRTHPFSSDDVYRFKLEKLISGENSGNKPLSYEMYQNYPNPFNPVTTISYTIPEASRVELKVYDILGREVVTLVNREQNAGKYNVQFDAGRLSSGIYIYRISAKNFTKTNKMVLLK